MPITIRQFDFHTENPGPLFDLMERGFGRPVSENIWKWKYMEYPYSQDIKVFVAEEHRRILGATTRFPVDIRLDDQTHRVFFSIDSVVDPNSRGKGVMTSLYRHTAQTVSAMYSKGTNPDMGRIVLRTGLGYKALTPNTRMVHCLSPFKWIARRLGMNTQPKAQSSAAANGQPGLCNIKQFGSEFDEFWNRVSPMYPGIVVKNADYMNWRYVYIPHIQYHRFYRRIREEIASVVVLRMGRTVGSIVDVIWDPCVPDEPVKIIRLANRFLKQCGLIKSTCWGTFETLRHGLRANYFFDRGEVIEFRGYCNPPSPDALSVGHMIHFVDGDGDSECCE